MGNNTTPLSKELSEQIEREAEALYPLQHNDIDTQKERRFVFKLGAIIYATQLQDSERRRKEANELLFPLLDYGQSKEANIPLGASITGVILKRAKQFEQAKKALEEAVIHHEEVRAEVLKLWPMDEEVKQSEVAWFTNAKALLASWKEEGKEGGA